MLHPPYGETSSDDIVRYSSAEKRVDGTNQKVNDSEQNTRGAEDSGEMGAFHFLLAPLRETDLRVRMQEYMPVGLEFGILYQS